MKRYHHTLVRNSYVISVIIQILACVIQTKKQSLYDYKSLNLHELFESFKTNEYTTFYFAYTKIWSD